MIEIRVKAYGLVRRSLPAGRTVTAAVPLRVSELLSQLGLAEPELMVLCDNRVVSLDDYIDRSCELVVVTPPCGG